MSYSDSEQSMSGRWRFGLGLLCFILAWAVHLVTVAVAAAGASAMTVGTVAAVSFSLNKVLLLASAGILGRDGFKRLKEIVLGALRRYSPPQEVGPTRYYVGLVLFMVPILVGWLSTYFPSFVPWFSRQSFGAAIIGDAVFVISLFVLGGDFWDKLRALFDRRARIVFSA
jgi:hypothetical protein